MYEVLESDSAVGLSEMVNKHIGEGWSPMGGVAVAVLHKAWENERKGYTESETIYTFAQAMIA